jgi:hypothetical protein
MRKFGLIPFLFLGLMACNDNDYVKHDASKAKPAAGHDAHGAAAAETHDAHDEHAGHAVDTTHGIEALPAIPDGAKVFFVNLKDGQKIKSPFKVQMGVTGIALDSAGAIKQASGHHHLLIDAGTSLEAGVVVPKDSTHLHFGNAQKEAEIKLTPGEHKLTLQYADGIHRSYGAKLASTVTVTVQ